MKSFRTRGAYMHHTEVTNILDQDHLFQENMRHLVARRPNASTFASVRTWLVRSAVARFNRLKREMSGARAGAAIIEKELILD